MAAIPYDYFEEALQIAKTNLFMEGNGHTAGIHSNNQANIIKAGTELSVSRLIVNAICATTAGGSIQNGLPVTNTLVHLDDALVVYPRTLELDDALRNRHAFQDVILLVLVILIQQLAQAFEHFLHALQEFLFPRIAVGKFVIDTLCISIHGSFSCALVGHVICLTYRMRRSWGAQCPLNQAGENHSSSFRSHGTHMLMLFPWTDLQPIAFRCRKRKKQLTNIVHYCSNFKSS